MNSGRARDRKICGSALLAAHVVDVGADAIAVARTFSRGIISSRRMMPSARPRSTMTLPYSTRFTVPLTISPMRSLYSPNWRSRSASRTFCTMTCLAFCAATRPNSSGGRCSAMRSPTLASGLRFWASASVIWVESFSTVVDHGQHPRRARVSPVLRVDFAADVVLGAIARFRGLLDRVFHGLDDDLAVDRLLARDRIRDLQQLEPVGADACDSPSVISSSSSSGSAPSSAEPVLPLFFARAAAPRGSSRRSAPAWLR